MDASGLPDMYTRSLRAAYKLCSQIMLIIFADYCEIGQEKPLLDYYPMHQII